MNLEISESSGRLIQPRMGQGAFRTAILTNYGSACAVSGERTVPALDAAHIKPYSVVKMHEEKNGILLRRDIHKLFDTGYVTITPDLKFKVSDRIQAEFGNGREYYALRDRHIDLPRAGPQPDREALEWHSEVIYTG